MSAAPTAAGSQVSSRSRARALIALIRQLLACVCGALALSAAVLCVRSFWHCDEAAYCTYLPATPSPSSRSPSHGIDRRQIIGSYRGGIFWLSWDADITCPVDWYGGPPTELIVDSAPLPRLVPQAMPESWGPRWVLGGFNFGGHRSASPRWRYKGLVVPHWALFLLLAWPVYRSLRHAWILRRRLKKGLCLNCGYDLRASPDICPECGKSTGGPAPPPSAGRRRRRLFPIAATGALVAAGAVLWVGVAHWQNRQSSALRLQPGMALSEHPLPQCLELEIAPGVWMRFALIPAGRFLMGSTPDEYGHADDEQQHLVTISKSFYMGQVCVTQEQYEAVMGTNPSNFIGARHPVDQVSWNDAVDFCHRVSQRTGRSVRLPTEAQWEYACRAGTTMPFNTGLTLPRNMARYWWLGTYPANRVGGWVGGSVAAGSAERGLAWLMQGGWVGGSVAAGSFPPNAWGLYDMHGNVWEWCNDYYGPYPAGDAVDPAGPEQGSNNSSRVLRGGSWNCFPLYCRAAFRNRLSPGLRLNLIGFRCLLDVP